MSLKDSELMRNILANPIEINQLLLFFFVKTQQNVVQFLLLFRPILSMKSSFMLLQQVFRSKDILHLTTNTLPHLTHEVALLMMALKFLEITIIDVFQTFRIDFADLTFQMGAHF